VKELTLLSAKRDVEGSASPRGGERAERGAGQGAPQGAQRQPAARGATGGPAAGAAKGTSGDDFEDFPGALEDEDDDLPF
jgi:single-strand DNA-binding protein